MSELRRQLEIAVTEARLRPLDHALADWCLRHGGSEPVALAIALVSLALTEGHSCLPCPQEGPALPGEAPFCSADEFAAALAESPLVGAPGDSRPLIVDGTRLYLHRYWQYEARLAAALRERIAADPQPVDIARLHGAGGLFADAWTGAEETNWQAVAAAVALRQRFAVISGGPGTGKTYTVLRLIAVLLQTAATRGDAPPRIRLAAPTGKAAARMMESIRTGLAQLPDAREVIEHLPDDATTLHRLLGIGRFSVQPRYHRQQPLVADVVIVDEASMIDLPMMAKLLDALPAECRLILLGDRYQLASVESGSVLAELCAAAGVNAFSAAQRTALAPLLASDSDPVAPERVAPDGSPQLADHVVTLRTSHRFHPESPIGRLAAAVNEGSISRIRTLAAEHHPTLSLQLVSDPDLDVLIDTMADAYAPLLSAESPDIALRSLESVRLLTATRVGPWGTESLNRRILECLEQRHGLDPRQAWFPGRPVMIRHNDYRAGLFNGDTGVCLRDADGHLRVWFRTTDGLQPFLPGAVPSHETVFAMTVHKSQGSEFRDVRLLLPARDSNVLCRELIYTGITRARERLEVLGPEAVLEAALGRTQVRYSGLRDRLGG